MTEPVFDTQIENPPKEFTSFSAWSYYHSVVLGHTLRSVKNDQQLNIEWHNTVTGEIWYVTPETTHDETPLC